jgi:hypothetical protein
MAAVLTATSTSLTARVDRVLDDAGLPAAPRSLNGDPAGDGYVTEPMTQCGPVRVAVRWHPGSRPGDPGLGLCRTALSAAGYLVETVYAAPGPYLAVLPPPGS